MSNYSRYIDFLTYKAAQSGTPLSGTFELTARCNLDCKMCYIHKKANDAVVKKSELSVAKWVEMAKIAQKNGMFLLLLTGGEPFLRPDFFELYSETKKLGLSVSINTNGTLINENVIKRLAEDFPARVNLTLYGASEETYRRLCGDGDAFNRACNAIMRLKEAGIPLKLNYSLTPLNKHDFDKIWEFAKVNGIPLQAATYMFPPVRACELCGYAPVRVSADEAAEYAFRYDLLRFGANAMLERCRDMLNGVNLTEVSECMEIPTEKIRCRAGLTSFWITYDGQMRPCGMMREPTVSVLRDDGDIAFDEAWQCIRKEREKIYLPPACTSCSMRNACESCPASCYAENGEFARTPEYSCNKTMAYLKIARDFIQNSAKGENENEAE